MANICDDYDTVSALDPNNRDILNVVEELGNVEEKLPDELGAILCSTPAGNASMILSLTCTYWMIVDIGIASNNSAENQHTHEDSGRDKYSKSYKGKFISSNYLALGRPWNAAYISALSHYADSRFFTLGWELV